MNQRTCERCYHWQVYGYCAIEAIIPDSCQWFVDMEDISFYFSSGRQAARSKHERERASLPSQTRKKEQFDG